MSSFSEKGLLGELEQLVLLAVVRLDGEGYAVTVSGESEDFYESSRALLFAYVLAVTIIYLVLAAQFESFVDPLTILVAVAMSFTGALVTLLLTGEAEVVWDGPGVDAFAGAERLLRFRVHEGLWIASALPLRWSAPELASQLALGALLRQHEHR